MIEPDPRIAKLKGGAKQTASPAQFKRALRAEHANRDREPFDEEAAKEARRKARNRRRK